MLFRPVSGDYMSGKLVSIHVLQGNSSSKCPACFTNTVKDA